MSRQVRETLSNNPLCGLSGGERIVVQGAGFLADGDLVRVAR